MSFRYNIWLTSAILLMSLGSAEASQASEALQSLLQKYSRPAPDIKVKVAGATPPPVESSFAPASLEGIPEGGRLPASVTPAPAVAPAPTVVPAKTRHKAASRAPASTTKASPATAKRTRPKPEPSAPPPVAQPADAEVSEALLGNWGTFKPWLARKGVNLTLAYKGDLVSNFDGGLKRGSVYLGNVDVKAELDLEAIAGPKGLSLVLYGLGDHGGDPTKWVGDSFATTNIESPNTFKLYEAYLKQNVDDRFSILAGLRDLNADYYSTSASSGLINSAFGISPALSQTGVNGPSIFPVTSLALTFKYESPTTFFFQAGAFNATSGDPERSFGTHITTSTDNGYLFIWEAGFAKAEDGKAYRYSLGVWTYSHDSDPIDSNKNPTTNSGFYFLADKKLTSSLSVFFRHGIAHETVNDFKSSTEIGFSLQGLLGFRPDDKLNLGVARVKASNDYKDANASDSEEAAAEVNYRIEMGHGLTLTPDYQYIFNPGLAKTVKDAQVGTLRIEIVF